MKTGSAHHLRSTARKISVRLVLTISRRREKTFEVVKVVRVWRVVFPRKGNRRQVPVGVVNFVCSQMSSFPERSPLVIF